MEENDVPMEEGTLPNASIQGTLETFIKDITMKQENLVQLVSNTNANVLSFQQEMTQKFENYNKGTAHNISQYFLRGDSDKKCQHAGAGKC